MSPGPCLLASSPWSCPALPPGRPGSGSGDSAASGRAAAAAAMGPWQPWNCARIRLCIPCHLSPVPWPQYIVTSSTNSGLTLIVAYICCLIGTLCAKWEWPLWCWIFNLEPTCSTFIYQFLFAIRIYLNALTTIISKLQLRVFLRKLLLNTLNYVKTVHDMMQGAWKGINWNSGQFPLLTSAWGMDSVVCSCHKTSSISVISINNFSDLTSASDKNYFFALLTI